MTRWLPLLAVVVGACAAPDPGAPTRTPGAASTGDQQGAAPGEGDAGVGPVVVELFTSQGCSSCPPADRWLSGIRPRQVIAGRPVVPLAFHVDYWDDLGWSDPLASPAWSERQGWYARRLPRGRVYTPALVVGGRDHAVGSRTREIERLIGANAPTGVLAASLTRERDVLVVRADTPTGTTTWAAVVEDGYVTEVAAGENRGEVLRDDHVVRALLPVDGAVRIPVDPAWRDVRVVAFAQAADGAITAARSLP